MNDCKQGKWINKCDNCMTQSVTVTEVQEEGNKCREKRQAGGEGGV